MSEKKLYHFNPGNNNDDFILSQNVIVPNDIAKYLTSFQLSAVKFLYKNFEAHKACILNDESGLGKTASVAVFLNVILANNNEKRKCLIICKNEERIINWKFHLDILTTLSFKVVFNENEIDDHIVYLTKWESLRSSASLANYKFDCIIVDNRENLMANKICLAYLLRNYENKISLVIANQDVTIDLKEFHSILRLCRRLESKYRDFKVFEDKFELPLVQGCSSDNQKILESYFLRREKILNYCKEFCLRRFRHQYESQLPLVAANVYRLNVKKWQDAPIIAKIKPVQLNLFGINRRISFDRDTEELHNSYVNRGNREQNDDNLLNFFFSRKEEDEFNNEICRITTTITDNAVEQSTEVMSPLIFIPDDSNDSIINENDKIENLVSSTTKDENEVRIIHPTPIHLNKKSFWEKKSNRKINDETNYETELNSEPKLVRQTRLTSRKSKNNTLNLECKQISAPRISTRGQDRVTRSQAHKNKYLTLSMEDTIEKGKRDMDELSKRKKKCSILKETDKLSVPKLKRKNIGSYNSKKDNGKNENTVSTSSSDSSFTFMFDQSFGPIPSCISSTVEIFKQKTPKKLTYPVQLSGISIFDVQPSDAVHVIESTPELIVLSSSTDCSSCTNKKVKSRRENCSNDVKYTKLNNTVTSPDIFGSTIDESLNMICSQKSKHTANKIANFDGTKKNITKSLSHKLENRFQTDNSRKSKSPTDCEIFQPIEKNVRYRTISSNLPQYNKITKYLKSDYGHDTDKEFVSSSSQSIQSSPLLVYPKTPRKKKMHKIGKSTNESGGGSSTKPSPHSRNTSSNTTPTKTPTALTKWLIKPNTECYNKNDNYKNKDEEVISFRETRSLSVKKRRRLDMSFKD